MLKLIGGNRMYKIGRIGTGEVTVEEAEDARAAALKAGWDPAWCHVQDITDEVKRLETSGDLVDLRTPIARLMDIDEWIKLTGTGHVGGRR